VDLYLEWWGVFINMAEYGRRILLSHDAWHERRFKISFLINIQLIQGGKLQEFFQTCIDEKRLASVSKLCKKII
jgi:hypothetical protein